MESCLPNRGHLLPSVTVHPYSSSRSVRLNVHSVVAYDGESDSLQPYSARPPLRPPDEHEASLAVGLLKRKALAPMAQAWASTY